MGRMASPKENSLTGKMIREGASRSRASKQRIVHDAGRGQRAGLVAPMAVAHKYWGGGSTFYWAARGCVGPEEAYELLI